jgi:hypothetical protein
MQVPLCEAGDRSTREAGLNSNVPVAMVVVKLQHEPALDSLIRLKGKLSTH